MAKKDKCGGCSATERLNKVGGQAVLEGVMMKAGSRTVTTCRKEDGSLVVNDATFTSVRKKHKILNIPILRGVVNFVEMMILSVKTMNVSADAMGIEEEDDKFTLWLKKHFGIGISTVITVIGTVLGILLSLVLFMYLPSLISGLIDKFLLGGKLGVWTAVVEGVVKIGIFLLYLFLVSLMPEIKRTFMYHGAEHKSIACFEAGEELTPENAMKHKRFHPRCGTSFMFFMILLGIFAGLFVRLIFTNLITIAYVGIRLLLLPLVMGIGYEVIMLAGKKDNFFTRMLSAPGLWVQRITTKEPTEEMLEVAITSIKCALRDDYPEFREFFESRPWEKPEVSDVSDADASNQEENSAADEENTQKTDTESAESCEITDTAPELTENSSENESDNEAL